MLTCTRKELTELVTISAPTRVPDGQGGFTTTWAPLAGMPCYAKIKTDKAAEQHAQGAVRGQAIYQVTIRLRGDVKEGYRFQWAGVLYRVAPPFRESTRDRWLGFTITSGVAV